MRISREQIDEYLRKDYWTHELFSDYWDLRARECPRKEALVDSRGRYTWGQMKRLIDRTALGMVELGIERGQSVAVQVPDCVEFFLFRLGCEKAGLVSLALNRTLRHKELEYVLGRSRAAAIVIPWKHRGFDYFEMIKEISPSLPHLKHVFVIGPEVPPGAVSVEGLLLQPLEEKYAEDFLQERKLQTAEIGYLMSTTGTTGTSKLVQMHIAARVAAVRPHVEEWKVTSDDILAGLAPLPGGAGGTIGYWCPPLAGAKTVVIEHFTPEEGLRLIQDEKITMVGLVPSQLIGMLQHPDFAQYDLSSLRAIRSAGGYLPPSVAAEAEERMGCEILISYGGMDFGSLTAVAVGSPVEVRRATVGRPVHGNVIKLVDDKGKEVPSGEVGEIVVKSVSAPDGYFEDLETTRETFDDEGFVKTGDLGRFDRLGNVMIVGRRKDIVIRGGQNIYPGEIENLLLTHPKITDAAVVGMPDPVMGEKTCAFVVLKPGEQLSFEEVISHLRGEKIAPYKLPERLELVDEIPLVAGSKVDKKLLRARLVQGIERGQPHEVQ